MFKESNDLQHSQYILHRGTGTYREVGTGPHQFFAHTLIYYGGRLHPPRYFMLRHPYSMLTRLTVIQLLLSLLQTNKAVLTRFRIRAEMHSNFMV